MALNLAQELNLTLVGFARNQRLNIYTHPHRLTGLAEPSKKTEATVKESGSSLQPLTPGYSPEIPPAAPTNFVAKSLVLFYDFRYSY